MYHYNHLSISLFLCFNWLTPKIIVVVFHDFMFNSIELLSLWLIVFIMNMFSCYFHRLHAFFDTFHHSTVREVQMFEMNYGLLGFFQLFRPPLRSSIWNSYFKKRSKKVEFYPYFELKVQRLITQIDPVPMSWKNKCHA